jgi:hypothetical protein
MVHEDEPVFRAYGTIHKNLDAGDDSQQAQGNSGLRPAPGAEQAIGQGWKSEGQRN